MDEELKLAGNTQRKNLATLITRSVFIIVFVLTLMLLFQNYQVSKQIVSLEVARSTKQTASLLQSIFNFKLTSLEIQQDSDTRSGLLVSAITQKHLEKLDTLFSGIDKMDPSLAPDFRFITQVHKIIWHDRHSKFYGITLADISNLANDSSLVNTWRMVKVDSLLGMQYVLMRHTPVVDMQTGRIVGMMYVGIVINHNFTLVNALKSGSNVDDVVLAAGPTIIASTVDNTRAYSGQSLLENYRDNHERSPFVIAKTNLNIDGKKTFLSVYTVQNNERVAQLARSHYIWLGVVLLAVFLVAIISRIWLKRRVSSDLNNLMNYTSEVVESKRITEYKGSSIAEFDQIGRNLELTFKRLNEQERQFQDLFNFSLSPIMLWGKDGTLLNMNPSAQKHFNITDINAKGCHLLLRSILPQIHMSAQGATLTGVNVLVGDKIYRWNISPILVNDKVQSVIAQAQDITSFIEAEKQSQAAKEAAEESAQVRADFLARMSHELRTPLNGILGVSQLLKGVLKDQSNIEHVEVLCSSGEHLLAVLDDILDFSKIEQGKFHIQASEFRLQELLNAVSKIFHPLCEDKGIRLVVESNVDENCIVFSDQVRLNQILFNLVSNAVKFTHRGEVKVSVNLIQDVQQKFILTITSQDTGIGIEKDRLPHIFDPFVQAESTTTREYGGSGLGLAIVKSLVDLLSGNIEVKSEVDQGSSFHVSLPIEVRQQQGSKRATSLKVPPSELFNRKLLVLLVEDNHTNAFIAQAFCKKYGMDVEWVKDGVAAIEFLEHSNKVDLVLMDNQLPNLGGVEATQTIRQELKLDVPIYACTADGMQDTQQAFLSAGANYVIIKPIKEQALNDAFVYFKNHHYQDKYA
ncbi:ATP-binding protein [Vibrio sp. S4M6]|uniref:quorum-sensing autoinducer 2 sensor kinase/phosphatase LuxQ n=1 Tax=Vibrio sinus TaxID=2946865 RepID=UPI00202A5CB2|nr:quorum-sensing autoinducer 2 sensor kinase/phosphatase LuxQ [Vibrio sinus]MCL9779865.1 ATP-binding protein [Vibrio sinus]